ncbi:Sir2 family NAD+-dependent deacetylase [Pelagibaculum spongiae]|uniref:NAD-dependent protein deacylase n=1 Tax=Pelagibaculum spongiae TaxID=2080658 RepID=A0A2V1GUI5_9GAMM|nr:NAD-dependent protein deacylase [Pelagibaculum spongiae]
MNYQSIVVLTGAGISAESGIRTFRASDGLWEDHKIEDVCTPEAFAKNPALVHQFYNQRRQQLLSKEIQPNAAHIALAEFEAKLEAKCAGEFLLVTQNVDNLHERAGSQNLIHMHGELLQSFCLACDQRTEQLTDSSSKSICPACQQIGSLRPDIVWFGEMPYQMDRIYRQLEQCDLFISIGASGNVYPAAGFVEAAKIAGAHCVELNLEPSATMSQFDEVHNGTATQLVASWLAQNIPEVIGNTDS